jgi:hypothetical protein
MSLEGRGKPRPSVLWSVQKERPRITAALRSCEIVDHHVSARRAIHGEESNDTGATSARWQARPTSPGCFPGVAKAPASRSDRLPCSPAPALPSPHPVSSPGGQSRRRRSEGRVLSQRCRVGGVPILGSDALQLDRTAPRNPPRTTHPRRQERHHGAPAKPLLPASSM